MAKRHAKTGKVAARRAANDALVTAIAESPDVLRTEIVLNVGGRGRGKSLRKILKMADQVTITFDNPEQTALAPETAGASKPKFQTIPHLGGAAITQDLGVFPREIDPSALGLAADVALGLEDGMNFIGTETGLSQVLGELTAPPEQPGTGVYL